MQGQVRQMPTAEPHPHPCICLFINDKVKCIKEEILEALTCFCVWLEMLAFYFSAPGRLGMPGICVSFHDRWYWSSEEISCPAGAILFFVAQILIQQREGGAGSVSKVPAD